MQINPSQTYPRCPFCGLIAEVSGSSLHRFDCIRCGEFTVSKEALLILYHQTLGSRQVANISGYLAENHNPQILSSDIEFLKNLPTPTVLERATRLLKCVAKRQPSLGERLTISEWTILNRALDAFALSPSLNLSGSAFERFKHWIPWLSATWAESYRELVFLLETCLDGELQFVKVETEGQEKFVTILPKGWMHLEGAPQGVTDVGFVAMWFDDQTTQAWEKSIHPAIYAAGYKPDRIDKKEHNNKIDDEILASIRAAKFVVADFTGHRGGVYYEAGFAQGLGKKVIWTVREDEISKAHFDTRQYNHILWKPDRLQDFRHALQLRIEASLGRGSIHPIS